MAHTEQRAVHPGEAGRPDIAGAPADLGVDRVAVRDDRGDQLAGQRRRPSASRSISARWRSRIASARALAEVRLEDRREGQSRRPVRRPRTRSAPDAIDQDGDGRRARGRAGARRSPRRSTGPGAVSGTSGWPGRATIQTPDADAVVAERGPRPRSADQPAPGAVRRGRPARRPGPRSAASRTSSAMTPAPTVSSGRSRRVLRPAPAARPARRRRPAGGATRARRLAPARATRRSAPGRRVRAIVAATSHGVRDHPPPGPAVGDDHRPAHAEQRRPADASRSRTTSRIRRDAGPHQQVRRAARASEPRNSRPQQVEDEASTGPRRT